MNTISVLLTGTSYPRNNRDWRGRFIADMVNNLACCKNISLKTWLPPGNLPSNVVSTNSKNESIFLKKMTQKEGIAQLLRTHNPFEYLWILRLLIHLRSVYQRESQSDVLHVNWLQNLIPLWGFNTPALVTVLGTDYKLLKFPGMVNLLRSVMKQRKTIIAPNAHWMADLLHKHFGDIAQIRTIPFGVEQRWFDINRHFTGKGVNHWITVSRLTKNKIGPLFDWGKNLFNENNTLCLFGPNQENLSIPSWVDYRGTTHPTELEDKWFPKAAALITLSKHDEGRPQVILEAMATGLPVITSDLVAHHDIVTHKKTGWIVKSSEELKQAIEFLSIPENNKRMGIAAKEWIKSNIGTWKDCATRYKTAYAMLTGKTL